MYSLAFPATGATTKACPAGGGGPGSKRSLEVHLAPRDLVVRRRVMGEGDDAPSREQPDVFLRVKTS